ncbi:ABC transporter substrate-binding protein [Shewanella oneidensis MR-1]|uniref:ABC-type phospholipid uptake (Salvage) system periplasmic chaperone MlaC n=1 Tax=Shewanella oneidensis (strain ATCC 700550 / JCM 31522 / CIP 106686 / LMG 19005 / NCIMB 14063 / MR-1) TaxID=211586 RepID=Q8EAF5_SHEON|nr:ABC transporter substrate-binding protein [Shewanella oneidensis]AAN56925.1 ABC-type phospholipid uptake (salvage) system periplasmic chaperone MlaC [Shewanella oneidensis MR-1]MDX5998718.1 ABC transporter substrate-binding protein [Shewanella oneidensis]MEE2028450.1 Intermembrane phospholipid transport system binding protein MlaC [Shewanella oneidensis]QKG98243.1 ABC transporter substrate-binding protein [Shewanella oneidensis MR-1]
MFKRLSRFLLPLVWIFTATTALADDTQINTMDPYSMVKSVANKTFDRFHKDKALIDADADHLKVIVREELMPYIDYKYASYKVLGQYLKESTEDQRNRFVDAFQGYLVTTYAQAFTEYTNQKVEFSPGSDFSNEKIVDVNVQIIEAGRPPIKLLFKARRLKDDSWKAFDLVAEGVSLLSSKQSEISNLIRQQGIEPVIKMLEERTKDKVTKQPKAGK